MKRSMVIAAAVLALASLASTATIRRAMADDCRPSTTASAGVSLRTGGSRDYLTLQACERAITSWSKLVKARYSALFASWSTSKDRSKTVRTEGALLVCHIRATPCAPTVRAPSR
jgi:hypothetical protein